MANPAGPCCEPSLFFNFSPTSCRLIFATIWGIILASSVLYALLGPTRMHKTSSAMLSVASCFALQRNIHLLFHIAPPRPETERYQFVHGIRALASVFIVIAHSSAFILTLHEMPISYLARHPHDMRAIAQRLWAQPVSQGALIVLTFFILSGMFLMTTLASRKRLKVGFGSYVLVRWMR